MSHARPVNQRSERLAVLVPQIQELWVRRYAERLFLELVEVQNIAYAFFSGKDASTGISR